MHKAVAILALVLIPFYAHAQSASGLAHWVQIGPGGAAELRVVAGAAACPDLSIDGRQTQLQTRAEPSADFPRLCSIALPGSAKQIVFEGSAVPLPDAAPSRIAVIGDTGCRIKNGTVQDCNDPAKWPFLRIANEIAALKPDLILDVGDYLYRESKCPRGKADSCGNSPYGDNWTTWDADFFAPARAMLDTAPIVPVRGNHEDCQRAGPGWLRLLGPDSYDPAAPCDGHLPPYAVPLGAMTLVVMDDANAPDPIADRSESEVYRNEFVELSMLAPAPIWLAMHRPIAGAVRLFGLSLGGNRTLLASVDPATLAPVSLMFSGHIHTFEAINYDNGAPPQLIAGNGGDKLDSAAADLKGANLGGWRVKDGISLPGFGFLLLTRRDADWRIDVHAVDGSVDRVCSFANRRIECPEN